MSGDVQPRKRKDKKKKRDDSDAKAADLFARKMSVKDDDETKSPAGVHATKMGPDDIQIHVHSDHGTGGHWCAKILFFSLMAVLLGLIGLIVLENRGLSDLDTPLSESRFADYLEGWVEEKRESHDDHDVLQSLDHLDDHDHDEPFEEEDDHDENDEQDEEEDHEDEGEDHEDEGEDHDDENDDEDDNPDTNDEENDEPDTRDGEDQDEEDDETDDNEQLENSSSINEHENEEDDEQNFNENDDNDNDNEQPQDDDNNDEDDNNDDNQESNKNDDDENDEGFEDQLSDNIYDDDNRPFEEHVTKTNLVPNLNASTNMTSISAEELARQVDDLYDVFNNLAESFNVSKYAAEDDVTGGGKVKQAKEDDDDNDASNEEFIDNDKGEDEHLQKLTQENENEDEQPEESSSLTVKLLVGLALVVVAHLVLVKRSKSNDDDVIESSPIESNELKRRLTLITADETIPSDVDDEQPNEDEDEYDEGGLNDGKEEDIKGDDNEPECENEDENYSEGDEEEEEDEESIEHVDDIQPVEEITSTVDTFTQMKNMYRPNIDQSLVSDKNVDTKEATQAEQAGIAETDNKTDDVLHLDDEDDYDEDIDEGSNSEHEVDDEELEDEEIDEEDISDVDDEDLMKRLDSKYGKLPESKSSDEEESVEKWTKVNRGGPQYNDDDFEEELRRTNDMLEDNPTSALKSFEFLIEIKPNSSKAWYGKGRALDLLSEEQKSNEILKEAIVAYLKAVEFGSSVDDKTFKMFAERCIDRMRFIGQHLKAVLVHESLIERFNDDPYFRNQLAVTYLLINRLADAKLVLHDILLRWRHDGFALVHYGFVLKNLDKNNEAAAVFLQEGIDSNAEGTNDGRFYFNLGEALTRLGRNDEAMAVYRKGASKKLFMSEYQRSLYNVDRLKSHPFWTKKETGYKKFFDVLEQNWEAIRDEGLNVLNDKGHFTDESENLRDIGDWKQFDLFARGRKMAKHCERTPFTCKIIEMFPAARFCKRGQVKFSVMHPGTHVWPHCGPTNCRIRAHLGLKVPEKTFIRVATETRSWKEGELLIFDDSFEHEVWHNGTTVRLVLIVDVWHPDLTEEERTHLFPI